MTRRQRLTLALSAVGVVSLGGFIASQFWGVAFPPSGDAGYVIDDVQGVAHLGKYLFYIVDCPEQPKDWDYVTSSCGNLRLVEVNEQTWLLFNRGDYYPGMVGLTDPGGLAAPK